MNMRIIAACGAVCFGISVCFAKPATAKEVSSFANVFEPSSIVNSEQYASYQIAKSTFLPDRFDDLGLSDYNTFHGDYNISGCDEYPLSSCPSGTSCQPCPFDHTKYRVMTCQSPYYLSGGKCVCPPAVSLTYANDKCVKYCGSTCIQKTCAPSGNQSNCTNGTQNCDNGCGQNTRLCCVPCNHKVTSKPANSTYTYESCNDGNGSKQIQTGWKCNSGYHEKSSSCEKDCISNTCSGYILSSCPANANCSPCTITATDCSTGGVKYRIDSCQDGYMVSGNTCVEKGIRDCAALQAALSEAAYGQTVSMDADITCSKTLTMPNNVTLNGNNHKLTFSYFNDNAIVGNTYNAISDITIESSVASSFFVGEELSLTNVTFETAFSTSTSDTFDVDTLNFYGTSYIHPTSIDALIFSGDNLTIAQDADVTLRSSRGIWCRKEFNVDGKFKIEELPQQRLLKFKDVNINKGGNLSVFGKGETTPDNRFTSQKMIIAENASVDLNGMGIWAESGEITIAGNLSINVGSDYDFASSFDDGIYGSGFTLTINSGGSLNIVTFGDHSNGISIADVFGEFTHLQNNGKLNITTYGKYAHGISGRSNTFFSQDLDPNSITNIKTSGVGMAVKDFHFFNGTINIISSLNQDEYYIYPERGGLFVKDSISIMNGKLYVETNGPGLNGATAGFVSAAVSFRQNFDIFSGEVNIINKSSSGKALSDNDTSTSSLNIYDGILNVNNKAINVANNIRTIRLSGSKGQFNMKGMMEVENIQITTGKFNIYCGIYNKPCFDNFPTELEIWDEFNLYSAGSAFKDVNLDILDSTILRMKYARSMVDGNSSHISAHKGSIINTPEAQYVADKRISRVSIPRGSAAPNINGFTKNKNITLTNMPAEFDQIFSSGIFAQ